MKRLIFIVSIVVLFSSCFTLSDGNIGSSSAALSTNNFKYLRTVNGKSQSVMILGLGGLNDGLVKKAVNYLRKDLKSNQALTNITIDKNVTFWFGGLIINQKIYASADIVEFNNEQSSFIRPSSQRGKKKAKKDVSALDITNPKIIEKEKIGDPDRITMDKVMIESTEYKVDDKIIYAQGMSRKEAVIQAISKKGKRYLFDILIIEDKTIKTVKSGNIFPYIP